MSKKEIMSLQDFMKGNYEINKPRNVLNYSIIPIIPKMMFFNKPVLILLGVGATFYLISEIERMIFKSGNEGLAEMVNFIINLLLPIFGFGAFLWLIAKAFQIFL